jgi:hypothetical protein
MYSVDKDNFKRFLLEFPQQIANSQNIFLENTPDLSNKFQNKRSFV